VYVAFETGAIAEIEPANPSAPRHFAAGPSHPYGIAAVDGHLLLCDEAGAWESFITFDALGDTVDFRDFRYRSDTYAWSVSRRRLYHLNDGSSPRDLHYQQVDADGMLGLQGDSPYHGNYPFRQPVRLSPDESLVFVGSGHLFDAATLVHVGELETDDEFADAVWTAEGLLTVRGDLGSLLEFWGPSFGQPIASTGRAGRPRGLVAHAGGVWLVSVVEGDVKVVPIAFADLDGDGVPVPDDAFPDDPDEWGDRDGDGTGDNGDAFPDDPAEWGDYDLDGVGDNADAFPTDPAETADSDGDGVGDNADAFPEDATEWDDTDGDGIGDNADPDPYGEPFLALELDGFEQLRLGRVRMPDLPNHSRFGLLPDGRLVACDPTECLFGTHRVRGRSGRRFSVSLDLAAAELMGERLEAIFLAGLEREFGAGNAEVDLRLRRDRERGSIAVSRKGRARLVWKQPFEVTLTVLSTGASVTRRGWYGWKFSGSADAPAAREPGSP
jgi:hypothetical protein